MSEFRSWLKLVVYRFTVSNEELDMCRRDRKSMNNIRRNFNEIENRMRIHEKQGGCCSEAGGSGVSLMLMGFKICVFRPIGEQPQKNTGHSGQSRVVSLDNYRKK